MDNQPYDFDVTRFLADHDLENSSDQASAEPASPKKCEREWDLPGFHGKARVSTTFGDLPVMGLRLRDRVRTISGDYKPVKRIDEIRLDAGFLERSPEAQPIRIGRGTLGENCPKVDILLSPAQKLSPSNEWSTPKLKSAMDLLSRPNIGRSIETSISYYLFHCGEKDIVQIDGVWCEISP